MTPLDRFIACMEYQSADRRPNHELGVWAQTKHRWQQEAPDIVNNFEWNWFYHEDALNLDPRDFVPIDYGFMPRFDSNVLESNPEYDIVQDELGIVTKRLKEGEVDGFRMSMDQFLRFPVEKPEDFPDIKRRLIAAMPERYPANLNERIPIWKQRDYPLVLAENCAANGFYWRAREFMGTENLSLAWYDYPDLMHEMMEFFADFIIETSRPVLEKINVEYFTLNEDMSMKGGPLLSPATFKTFIFPHLKRMVEFFKSHGVKYFVVDTDGNPTLLLPLLLDAGVDTLWPIERAADFSPLDVRKKFGKSLRLWGGVDKRVLARGKDAIRNHLQELIPLIEEGGFIPTVDHLVPPDVSWDNFRYYMDYKQALLSGNFKILE
jgi:uroporphyrinogen decarboxylase